jgi:hypothetical protein
MGAFKDALKKIGDAVQDATSLDVVMYQGSIEADLIANGMPDNFQKVLELAAGSTQVKVKLLASTQVKLDGDILAYYDTGITADQAKAHAELVSLGQKTREATIDFVHRVVGLDYIP